MAKSTFLGKTVFDDRRLIPIQQPSSMITCNRCGQQWPRDPALEVECPVCKAKPGCKCTVNRPSEHKLNPSFVNSKHIHQGIHDERDILAMKTVPGYGKCTGKKPNDKK